MIRMITMMIIFDDHDHDHDANTNSVKCVFQFVLATLVALHATLISD